ncbi:MAG: GHKL domain-containing protein [Gammaproteobacteria bacterium]|nr:MAG: GHKL domain-containing protein [Gammaproteobacteria bacterium]
MASSYPQKRWLPYLIGGIGSFISFLVWYILEYRVEPYFLSSPFLQTYHPWVILLVGIALSVLLAFTVANAQTARQGALVLKQMNEDLKKEISERMNAEESKQKLEIALLQGQKLQAMGTLAGGIAHDFNNILYAIIGYVEMAREDVEKESLIHKNLGKVLDATHRGQDLVSRILAFSRRQHQQYNPIHLKNTIEAALALLQPTIPASVMLHFEASAEPLVQGNQTQLHQVLVNLINNAVDAMEGEGTITLRLDVVPIGDRLLKQFPAIPGQNYCKIEIMDSGHGMDQHTMERIFEPFFTTKEVGKGTGLGLSIVHSIIKEHQGEITVTSKLGHGTKFEILLPEYIEKEGK